MSPRVSGSPIRACFVCTHSFALATLYKGLFPFLKSRGYQIDFIIGDDGYRQYDYEQFGGIDPILIPMERMPSPAADAVSLARFVAHFTRHRYDIIHVSTPKASLLGSLAARLTGNGPVLFVYRRCVYELMSGWRRRIYMANDRMTCRLAAAVAPISHQLLAFLRDEQLCEERKLHFIGSGSSNGIDTNHYSLRDETRAAGAALRESLGIAADVPVLLYVGRLSSEKGVDLLPDLLDRVRARHPNVRLVIAGPEEPRDMPSDATIARIASDPAICRIGYVKDPAPLYALADVFVFPSFFEGFGNVLLEAAAMERPAVAFAVPGVAEAVADGESGFLVPSGDVDAMAAAAIALLDDEALRERISRQARDRVHRLFGQEAIWGGLDALMRGLARQR